MIKTWLSMELAFCLTALLLTAACETTTRAERDARDAAIVRAEKGQALFQEKCRTVAGERIYRTVRDVEGIVILKVRPQVGGREWADQMWPGAAFAIEASGDSYITTFLGFEHAAGNFKGKPDVITPEQRGYVTTDRRPGGLPGYRFVDVIDEKDGRRYRYTGRWEEPWQKDKSYLKGYIKFFLDRAPAPIPAPRYGVTFDDHVIVEERALGVASSTIKVIDIQTNEILGELTRYVWSPGGASPMNPSPWLSAYKCPGHAVGASSATRKFVDQILVPRRED